MHKILVVEDDRDLCDLLAKLLEDEGYCVLRARQGRDALELLRCSEELPSLVLFDLRMPVMDGQELALELRKEALYAHLPLLAMTAGPKSRAPKGVPVITKPLEIDTLLDRIDALLTPNSAPSTKIKAPKRIVDHLNQI